MKVGTPLGEYSFQFRRVERRGREIVVVGLVAGMESSVVVGPENLRPGLRLVGPPLALVALVLALRRRAR
jgi:peptidoglycan/LPS O-acetylase OafA/YrhL